MRLSQEHRCCHAAECIEAQKQQKEKIIEESTQEYSAIKKDYDSFVRRYKGYLDVVDIERYHPDDYDEFMQAKQERMEKMTALKKEADTKRFAFCGTV